MRLLVGGVFARGLDGDAEASGADDSDGGVCGDEPGVGDDVDEFAVEFCGAGGAEVVGGEAEVVEFDDGVWVEFAGERWAVGVIVDRGLEDESVEDGEGSVGLADEVDGDGSDEEGEEDDGEGLDDLRGGGGGWSVDDGADETGEKGDDAGGGEDDEAWEGEEFGEDECDAEEDGGDGPPRGGADEHGWRDESEDAEAGDESGEPDAGGHHFDEERDEEDDDERAFDVDGGEERDGAFGPGDGEALECGGAEVGAEFVVVADGLGGECVAFEVFGLEDEEGGAVGDVLEVAPVVGRFLGEVGSGGGLVDAHVDLACELGVEVGDGGLEVGVVGGGRVLRRRVGLGLCGSGGDAGACAWGLGVEELSVFVLVDEESFAGGGVLDEPELDAEREEGLDELFVVAASACGVDDFGDEWGKDLLAFGFGE